MKNLFTALLSLSFLIFLQNSAPAMGGQKCREPEGCGNSPNVLSGDATSFTRTYKHFKTTSHNKVTRSDHSARGSGLVITEAEFRDHIDVDKERFVSIIARGNIIPMDVGAFDQFGDERQEWEMPDFNDFELFSGDPTIQHVTPESTGFAHAFPEATHCFFFPYQNQNVYQFAEMTSDDLFILGTVEVDEDDYGYIFDTYLTATPVPLELGLEFEGTVIVEYTDDPEIDSMISIQDYIVSGYGTLNTYDEGPVDAIKLNYSELSLEFKNGEVIDSVTVRNIVWYSSKGHYVRGRLDEDVPATGQTTFNEMVYQRLDTGVSTREVEDYTGLLNYFPNPISAGEVLNITIEEDMEFGLIQLFDMHGRVVQQVDLSGMGPLRSFQVQLSESLVAGIYTYTVQNMQGKLIGQGKLQIQ